jgi:hypothetical protein
MFERILRSNGRTGHVEHFVITVESDNPRADNPIAPLLVSRKRGLSVVI